MEKSHITTSLKAFRESNGLSQSALANAIGVNQAQVSRWERGGGMTPSAKFVVGKLLSGEIKLPNAQREGVAA